MASKAGNPGLRGKLIEKSIEAYILSLETINRLSIKYRLEAFTYLLCNAWELLLKAKIIQDTKNRESVYYKDKSKPRRSLALRDCLKSIFLNENDPIRRNIERITDLRDEVVHLVISQIPKDILALLQASVLNYHKKLNEWFNISLSDRVSVGMMTIIYDFSPDRLDLSSSVLRRQLGHDTAEYLARFQTEVKREFDNLGKPAEFSIDIGYKLALVKKTGNADIVLTMGNIGKVMGIVEVAKDPGRTHPYRRKELLEQVNTALSGHIKITTHDIQCIINVHKIRGRSDFYYQGTVKGSPVQYSQDFVEWIVKQYNDNDNFFVQTRQKVQLQKGKNKLLGPA